MKEKYRLSIVIPVFNAAESLNELHREIAECAQDNSYYIEIVYVDDCSSDGSWQVLSELKDKYKDTVKIIRLAMNSGQHNAILCGFHNVSKDIDYVFTMDDDLQHPPSELPKLVDKLNKGFDLVIGRYDSKKHAVSRNLCSKMVNWLIRKNYNMPNDFSFTSFQGIKREILPGVISMTGVYPFIVCMLLANSSSYANVLVHHDIRRHGGSNYNFSRSIKLFLNLVLNYTSYPLWIVGAVCFFTLLMTGLLMIYVFSLWAWRGTAPGWASTMLLTSFLHSMSLGCIFIFAIYISRINSQISNSKVKYRIAELHE
jgi:glycosyltransferase involved in cell wall biosynthesis